MNIAQSLHVAIFVFSRHLLNVTVKACDASSIFVDQQMLLLLINNYGTVSQAMINAETGHLTFPEVISMQLLFTIITTTTITIMIII